MKPYRSYDMRHPHEIVNPHRGVPGYLTPQEARRINEAYANFCVVAPLLTETRSSVSPFQRIRSFEEFLIAESDDFLGTGRPLIELWDGIKKAASKAAGFTKKVASKAIGAVGKGLDKTVGRAGKAVSKAVAGKSRLERGGSLFGLGKKSRLQKAEYDKMLTDEGVVGDTIWAIKDQLSKDWPNNDKAEDFQKETLAALKAVQDLAAKNTEQSSTILNTYNKWLTYVLDQQLSDHYTHFMESRRHINGRMLIENRELTIEMNEAVVRRMVRRELQVQLDEGILDSVKGFFGGKGKGKEKGEKEKEEDEPLSAKAGSSETIKGLKSEFLPKMLKLLGGLGLGIAGGILAANPGLLSMNFLKAVVQEDVKQVQDMIETKTGAAEVAVQVKSRFVKDCLSEMAKQSGGVELKSPDDYKSFMQGYQGGPAQLFKDLGVSAPQGKVSDTNAKQLSDYVIKRLEGGMSPDKAFEIGDKAKEGSMAPGLERFGGATGKPVSLKMSIAGAVVKQIFNRTVKESIVKMVATGAAGSAATATAIGLAGGVGLGSVLAGYAVQALRKKSQDPKYSRAAWLNDLYQASEQKLEELPPPKPDTDDIEIDVDTSDFDPSSPPLPDGKPGDKPDGKPSTALALPPDAALAVVEPISNALTTIGVPDKDQKSIVKAAEDVLDKIEPDSKLKDVVAAMELSKPISSALAAFDEKEFNKVARGFKQAKKEETKAEEKKSEKTGTGGAEKQKPLGRMTIDQALAEFGLDSNAQKDPEETKKKVRKEFLKIAVKFHPDKVNQALQRGEIDDAAAEERSSRFTAASAALAFLRNKGLAENVSYHRGGALTEGSFSRTSYDDSSTVLIERWQRLAGLV